MKFKSTLFAFMGLNLWNTPFTELDPCLLRSPFLEAQSKEQFSVDLLKPNVQTCFLKSGHPFPLTALRSVGNWNLTVIPGTPRTRFVHRSCLKCDGTWPFVMENLYSKQKDRLNLPSGFANQGLRSGGSEGVILTADLCPTSKPLDRRPFQALIDRTDIPKPIPFYLAVSGRWMLNHRDDLKWLLSLEREGKFAWTWVNHSYTHPNKPGVSNAHNFLALPNMNLESEVLRTEKMMIAHGITPSVFFRFPGLISTKKLHSKLKALGLIPLGASAWLAKGQKTNPGAIVLIHANGNEPKGIQKFLDLSKDGKLLRPREIGFEDLEL
ncbi:MAG: hypothetical protein K2X47_14430 [Bdellovibrionales bacterium]|nr:hypothetical protein [Bdellovibrionales bacterium]